MAQAAPTPAAPVATASDRLEQMTTRLLQLTKDVAALCQEAENIALQILSDNERHEEEVKKLRQLQSLLKSLG